MEQWVAGLAGLAAEGVTPAVRSKCRCSVMVDAHNSETILVSVVPATRHAAEIQSTYTSSFRFSSIRQSASSARWRGGSPP